MKFEHKKNEDLDANSVGVSRNVGGVTPWVYFWRLNVAIPCPGKRQKKTLDRELRVPPSSSVCVDNVGEMGTITSTPTVAD